MLIVTMDLWMLVGAVLLTVLLIVPAGVGGFLQWGTSGLAGNRDDLPSLTGWPGRADRAHRNMVENVVLFAAIVLVAHVAGAGNAMTALGSQIFLACRVAHAILYIIGVPYLRSVAWTGGVVGIVIVASQLF
jgi:uncharacterized MAPEG superfamily protein